MSKLQDERVTAKPKFDDPYVLVNVQLLDRAFTMAKAGCTQKGCRKKAFQSHSIKVDASCAKITFLCGEGHPTTWASSEQVGRQMLILNKLVPAAAVMSGLKLVPMKRFLGLLCVDSQDPDYMKKGTLNLLVKLTNEVFAEEMERTRQEMLEYTTFDAGMS